MVFMFFVFGIVGQNMFSGKLRMRCAWVDPESHTMLAMYMPAYDANRFCKTGTPTSSGFYCPVEEEFDEFGVLTRMVECIDIGENPNSNLTGFDNIFQAFITIFTCITLEGWSDTMYWISDTTNTWSQFYFILLVFLGSLFVLNLVVAVLSVNYSLERDSEDNENSGAKSELEIKAEARRLEKEWYEKGGMYRRVAESTMRLMVSYERNHHKPDYSIISRQDYEGYLDMYGGREYDAYLKKHFKKYVGRLPSQKSFYEPNASPSSQPIPSYPVQPSSSTSLLVNSQGPASYSSSDSKSSLSTHKRDVAFSLDHMEESASAEDALANYIHNPSAQLTHARKVVGGAMDMFDEGRVVDSLYILEEAVTQMREAVELQERDKKQFAYPEEYGEPAGEAADAKGLTVWCYTVVMQRWFTPLVIALILFNTVCMAVEFFLMPMWLILFVDYANQVLTVLFTLEMVLKMKGFGFTCYFRDQFNTFDALIVGLSWMEILFATGEVCLCLGPFVC